MADVNQRFRVTKIAGGFLVAAEGDKDEIVDPATKAVLDLYEEMLKAGRVKLLAPKEAQTRFEKILQRSSRAHAPLRKDRPAPR